MNSDEDSKESSSSDFSEEDDVEEEPPPPSETRMIREMGQGTRDLVSSRLGPTRQEPQAQPMRITKVNSLYNYNFVKPIPVAEAHSQKRAKRKEPTMVEPSAIQVPSFTYSAFLVWFNHKLIIKPYF
jgi:hypothetical protein